jgi:hypothetical protein
LNEALD